MTENRTLETTQPKRGPGRPKKGEIINKQPKVVKPYGRPRKYPEGVIEHNIKRILVDRKEYRKLQEDYKRLLELEQFYKEISNLNTSQTHSN
jgi:hypothetical protein